MRKSTPKKKINKNLNQGVVKLLAEIDQALADLRQARVVLLAKDPTHLPAKAAKAAKATRAPAAASKRKLTAEGRARIAEAAKRRWAKQKGKVAGA